MRSIVGALGALLLGLWSGVAAAEPYWIEPGFAEFPLKGADTALGLVIWNHGLKADQRQYKQPPPTVVRGLAARGWDVIKLDRDPLWENSWSNAGKRHIERLIEEVASARAKGYKRIILAGGSYGGAIALSAADRIDGLWGVLALSPGNGQDVDEITHRPLDTWTDSIVRETYDELRAVHPARLVAVFPAGDEYVGTPRGDGARNILSERPDLSFLLIDEKAPLNGHLAFASKAFYPYAACIGHFFDPALIPAPGAFRCGHDEFAQVRKTIRAINAHTLPDGAPTWFGYADEVGEELVLSLHDGARAAPLVDYAWGPGVLAAHKPGVVTVAAEQTATGLALHLSDNVTVETATAADGSLHLRYLRDGKQQNTATLYRVGP